MAKAAKSSKTTTKATKAAKKTAAAGKGKGKGKENTTSKTQNARSIAGKGGTKKKSGGSSAGGEGDKKKSGVITKAVSKKIEKWWKDNSDNLVKTAVDDYMWEEGRARDIAKAYQQFLIVKREMKDWENELLPCDKVATMMESHELNQDFDYQSDMKFLCGHDFGGKQLLVCGNDDDFDREKTTFDAVKKRFGSEFNEELWNTVRICIFGVDRRIKWDSDSASEDLDNSAFFVDRQKSDPLESAFEAYTLSGDPVEPTTDFQFLLSRTKEVIDPNDTALGLRLTSLDDIFALYISETLIDVKVKKKDSSRSRLFYAADQKKPFSKVLKDLVKDDEGDETDYVFLFKGKRLYGFETPMSLQMKHFDTIDAIPSQDYKYQRCICCNKSDLHDVEG